MSASNLIRANPDRILHPKQLRAFRSRATEILYGGAAGGGKSFFMRFLAVFCALALPGIQIYLFRRTYPDLEKNHLQGPTSFPVLLGHWINTGHAKYNSQKNIYSFKNGSRIFLCHCQYEKNVVDYQGAEIHLLLIDELTHFTEKMYRYLRGRCRLGTWQPPERYAGLFPRIFCGANPGGIGHNWVKATFVTFAPMFKVVQMGRDEGGMKRQYIPAKLSDNPTLQKNDPTYSDKLYGLGDPALVKAMLDGDWDIVAGGALDDVWRAEIHMIEPFVIPSNWHVNRSFDWGSSKPFSVGWWAEANGEEFKRKDGNTGWYPKGTRIRIAEWYGWNGKADQGCKMLAVDVATGIKERERRLGLMVRPGPADSAIFDTNNGMNIARDMAGKGVIWLPCDKGRGSRVNGLEIVRRYFKASLQQPMEEPGIFAFKHCLHFRRTMPTLPRDEHNPDDVNTKAEDHLYDDVRYQLTSNIVTATSQEV